MLYDFPERTFPDQKRRNPSQQANVLITKVIEVYVNFLLTKNIFCGGKWGERARGSQIYRNLLIFYFYENLQREGKVNVKPVKNKTGVCI